MILSLIANLFRLVFYPLLLWRRARAAPPGAWVTLEIDGPIVDLPRPSARFAFLRRGPARPALSVARMKELAEAIAHDPRVKGLLVQVRGVAAGPAVLSSLRDVLSEVRAAGKDVVCYLPLGADNKELYLASAARLVVVGPETTVAPLGFAATGRYVRRALERAGVEPEVFAKGMYKSAGEGLVRDTMSDAQREQLGAILEAFHDALVTALAQGRRVDRETATRWIDEAPHGAARAAELGMIDAVAYEDELDRLLAPADPRPDASAAGPASDYRSGAAPDGGASVGQAHRPVRVPAGAYLRARLATRFRPLFPRPVIGVVEVHGPIVSRPRLDFARVASEESIVAALRAARADHRVRGVVLHIDSPGGSALASDRIHHEVERLAEAKPVVAYMSNVAASGGYYVAAAAHAVVAQPQTVTGSIGVVSARFTVGPLLERFGVGISVVKRGARADLGSLDRRLDEEERTLVERELESIYRTFLKVVARGRKKPVEAIEPLAQGRVYSGTDAQARGLVDHLGGFDRALHEMRDRLGAGAKESQPVIIRPPRVMPPPPELPQPVQAALQSIGLGPLLEAANLAVHLDARDRVLAYWSADIDA